MTGAPRRHPMDDIETLCKDHTIAQMARRYGVQPCTVWKRLKRLGLKAYIETHEEVSARAKATHRSPSYNYKRYKMPTQSRPQGSADMAADFLRKFGPVYKCSADGKADYKGKHYRRGAHILTPSEIVEKAKRVGYDPDAWRRV